MQYRVIACNGKESEKEHTDIYMHTHTHMRMCN